MKQKGLMKKLSTVLLATAMTVSTFTQFSTLVYATEKANENTYDTLSTNESLNIEGGIKGRDYTYESGVITLLSDGNYTIIGDGNVTNDRIIVGDNVSGSLILRNVNISTNNTPCLEVKGTANLTLWLDGENSLRVNEDNPAALQFENVTTGSLIIDSKTNGKLVAYAWNGAGIGGSMFGAPKNLIIKGGIISATSGRSSNAIGKGWFSSENSDITIEGGIINTSSIWESNNGLGGTENSKITIKGGYVDCGITGNAVVLGGYITGNISGTVTNDNGIELNKVNIPLMLDNVKEIWIDGVNQNINNTFTDVLLQLYLTPEQHNIKIADSNGNEKTYVININGKIDGNSFIEFPQNLSITYKENLKLSNLALTQGWSWVNGDTSLSAGTKSYPATFDTINLESTTDFSKVDGYDVNTHKVTRNVEVTVDKANSQVNITTQSLDKVYDGNTVSVPEYTTSGSDGKVTITWQENTDSVDTPKWEDLKSAPSTVGTYRVVVELAGNDNYNPASATLNFVISQATNTWVEKLAITGWIYNEKANAPTAKAQFGDITFTYSSEENGTYTNEVPKNAGTWYVKATVTGTENHTGLESVVSFEVAKAIPAYEKVTGLVLGQGQSLSKIELPKQFKWVDETVIADELGTHTFKAIYTPEDTANYQTIEVEIEVEVVPTPVILNRVPTINASDKTITVGDKFEPLKDVTANDKEDGNLTSKIKVIKNTVDTKKAGTYEVAYQVTDSQGASVTKTIKVTAKTAPVNPDKDKPNNDKGSVETGDQTNVGLFTSLSMISALGIAVLAVWKKKKALENK